LTLTANPDAQINDTRDCDANRSPAIQPEREAMKCLMVLSTAVLFNSTAAMAGDGLELGAAVGTFYVKDVTGPAAGTELCYRCRFGNRPVISVFTRKITDEVGQLIKSVDDAVGKRSDRELAAFAVMLSDDADAEEASLKELATKYAIRNVPLTTFNDVTGPRGYLLSRDAEVTVMMWVDGELAVNETFNAGDLSEDTIAAVLQNTGKILK
jgi:hypothetical protein